MPFVEQREMPLPLAPFGHYQPPPPHQGWERLGFALLLLAIVAVYATVAAIARRRAAIGRSALDGIVTALAASVRFQRWLRGISHALWDRVEKRLKE